MTIPYRLETSGLTPGETYCVSIQWNAKSAGKHVVDFLTSYDRQVNHEYFGHPGEEVDPLLGTALEGRDITPQRVPIPAPQTIGSPISGQPAAAFNALPGEMRQLAVFNGQIVSLGYIEEDPLSAENAESSIEICFTVNPGEQSVVIAWGGHLAAPIIWGKGQTVAGEQGNPYMMSFIGCSGLGGCGARVLNLQATAVITGSICGIEGPAAICAGGSVPFSTLAPNLEGEVISWSLVNDGTAASIAGSATGTEVLINAGDQGGFFDLTLEINETETCSRRIFVFQPDEVGLSPQELALCEEEVTIPVEWVNLPEAEGVVRELTLLDENENPVGSARTPAGLFELLPSDGNTFFVFGTAYLENDPDCSGLETERVLVRRGTATPPAAFDVDASLACSGTALTFQDQTVVEDPAAFSWRWDFGDGNTSNLQNPVHTYAAGGTYTVSLTLVNEVGCEGGAAVRQITVQQAPSLSFVADPSPVCEEETVRFSVNSTAGDAPILGFEWQIEDGAPIPGPGLTIPFDEPGIYSVSLTARDANGCATTYEEELTVFEGPTAAFTAPDQCLGNTVAFQQESVAGDGTLTAFEWHFGDGNSSELPAPTHTYSEASSYLVQLSVTDENGCTGEVRNRVTAFEPVEVDAGPDLEVCEGETVRLEGAISGSLTGGAWSDRDLGGTFTTVSTNGQIIAIYTPPQGVTGPVELDLTSDDPAGPCPAGQATITLDIVEGVTVSVGEDREVCRDEMVQLQGSIEGPVTTGQWSDGGLGGSFSPDAFSLDASYSPPTGYEGAVTLTLTSDEPAGICGPESDQLTVQFNSLPSPDFSATAACEGQATLFSNLSEIDPEAPVDWLWRFGDGNTSTSPNPGHLYDEAGLYTVTLTMTDGKGCSNTVEKEVEVLALPQPSFTAENLCETENVQFINNTPAGDAAIYEWQFGDGNGSLTPSPIHRYAEAGTYTVSLTATNAEGCSATVSQSVEILKAPEVTFATQEGCQGEILSFEAVATPGSGDLLRYDWRFGDGTLGSGGTVTHAYAQAGNYLARLEVTDVNGCGAVYRAPVTVLPRAAVDAGTDIQTCEGTAVELNGAVSGPVGTGQWSDQGVGGTFSPIAGEPPQHAFYQPPAGWTDPVTLVLTSDDPAGPCPAESDALTLTIFAGLRVDAGPDQATCPGNTIQLSGSVQGVLSTGFWSDGGVGGTFTADAQTLNAQYTPPADYAQPITLTLTSNDPDGPCPPAGDDLTLSFETPPTADFQASPVCQGIEMIFVNTSTTDEDAASRWEWNFGDGNTSEQKNPTHVYAAAGEYEVSLTVTNSIGCWHTVRKTVRIYEGPQPAFTVEQPCENQAAAFLNNTEEGDAAVLNYQWRFGDGGMSQEAAPAHTYQTAGSYAVTLVASDQNGCQNQIEKTVDIYQRPAALFEVTEACLGQETRFEQGALPGEAAIQAYAWDFGDGSTSPEADPAHLYQAPGTYTVRLEVTDALGCSGSYESPVTVAGPVMVEAGPDKGYCEDGAVQLDGIISGDITGGFWSDGGIGGRFVPDNRTLNALYILPEGYREAVVLTLTSDDPAGACPPVSDELRLSFLAAPVVAFEADIACNGQPVQFDNASTAGSGTITEIFWDFGDGQSSTEPAPEHIFPEPGTYSVTLSITNSNGCTQSLTQPVTISPRPFPNFSAASTCPGQPVSFTNLSQIGDGVEVVYFWDFGDGATSTAENPVHTYQGGDSYRVILRVTDENGCSTALSKEVTLGTGPLVSFTADPVCVSSPMTFINTSESDMAALTEYRWDFGDGGSSEAANPVYQYKAPGIYDVTLSIEDNNGCRGTVTRQVEVYALPEPDFTTEGNCQGQQIQFTDLSTAGDGALMNFFWEFDAESSSTNRHPRYTFPEGGTYNVQLKVEDEYGCAAIMNKDIVVNIPPQAAFGVPDHCVGKTVAFANESLAGSTDITRYEWQFGDGNTSSEENPTHTYAEAGAYDVVLTVFGADGCSDFQIAEVLVFEAPSLSFTTEVFCTENAVQFSARATVNSGSITSYSWDFGDGEISMEVAPRHVFPGSGSYPVTLEVMTDKGCSRSLTQNVFIPESPVAAFSVTMGCEAPGPDILVFNESISAEGGDAPMSYLWIVLDDREREVARSRDETPDFDLPPGAYTLELTVSEETACSDLFSREIEVFPDPKISIEASALRVCNGEGTTLSATLEGGTGCRDVQWQRSNTPAGPWDILAGGNGTSYTTSAALPSGTYYYRARYRCDGNDCNTAVSNIVEIEVGQGEADLACLGQLNITLKDDCTAGVTPLMVATGTFGSCFPYRTEDFEVVVYDGMYPNGDPDNIIEGWGLFSYELKLKEEAAAAGGVFTPCWGNVQAVDMSAPQVTCPSDVTGLIGSGDSYRPAFGPAAAGTGEVFNYLTCNELDFVYRESRSWEDESYGYYTGLPEAVDGCDEATLIGVDDWLERPGCEDVSLAFGGQLSAKVIRTFTYQDSQGNIGTCDQTIYFFRPWVQLPDCEVRLDVCEYGDDQVLDPSDIEVAPYYLTGLGDTVLLLSTDCGFSVAYEDLFFPGTENCGFTLQRTWTILEDCRRAGLEVDLVDLPLTAEGCAGEPLWDGHVLKFEQQITVEDARPPVVECPAPSDGASVQQFSTGPFNCTAVINPLPPLVNGECQDWTWYFEVYGFILNPKTLIPEYKRIGQSTNHLLSGVAPGNYDLIYTVEDACGNVAVSEKCPIRVADQINPIAVCDNDLSISLGTGTGNGQGVAMIQAEAIAEGSWDNCTTELEFSIRRRIDAGCLDAYVQAVLNASFSFSDLRRETNGDREEYFYNDKRVIVREEEEYWSAWGPVVFTTCCDAGRPGGIEVVVRVRDEAGNENTCPATLTVEDQLPPRCSVEDQVIACTELDFDPRDPARVAARFGTPEEIVTVFDNCVTTISEQLIWSPQSCGRGTLERVFTVRDAGGLSSSCTQTISVEEVVDYEIEFPADESVASCSGAGGDDVLYQTFGCDLLAVNRDTVDFNTAGNSCHQLMIHHEVINWCEYGASANTTPTRVSRDIDGDDNLEEPTWVVVAFDPAFDAVVAKVFGADAAGNRLSTPARVYKPGDSGYNPGFFRYTQFVEIVDNEAPVVEVISEDLSFCSFEEVADGCSGDFSIRVKATDNCSLSTVFLQEVHLFAGDVEIPAGAGTYRFRQAGEEFITSGNLGLGAYRLSLRFDDGCGNSIVEHIDFEVVDCKAPVPNCKGLITADLLPTDTDGDGRADTGEIIIPAEAMIASEIADCSPFPDEPLHQVKYFVSRERPQGAEDLTDRTVRFTCDDNGIVNVVYLSALDAAGNFGTCEVRVFVEAGADPDPCDQFFGQGVIGGLVRTEEGDPVEDVMVRLSGQRNDFAMTDYNGMYRFEYLEEGYDYTVSPLRDDNYVNGVTTFDLLLISKHILAEKRLDSPYQLIAADANSDGRVTTFDLIQLRKLILTLTFDLDDNTSWRFIDAGYVFPDPANPWLEQFPEVLNVNDLGQIEEDGDFIAVKIGDVNGNARTSRLVEPEVRSGREVFIIRAEDQYMQAGEAYVIPVTTDNIREIEGYQFTLEIDERMAELVDIQYGLAQAEHFGVFPSEGVVTTSWIKPSGVHPQESVENTLFSLVIRPFQDVSLREILAVSSRYTPAEAYVENGALRDVSLHLDTQEAGTAFKLYQNRPNPWSRSTVIGFELPEAGAVVLRVLDVNGRQLYERRGAFSGGYNELRLDKQQFPAGVLYYVLETAAHTETRKMILIR